MTYMLKERDAEKRGEEQKAREMAIKMYRRGDNISDIADIIEVSADTVKKWLSGSKGTPLTMN